MRATTNVSAVARPGAAHRHLPCRAEPVDRERASQRPVGVGRVLRAAADRLSDAMIPKTIHYCWLGGGVKSDLIKRCMETWLEVMPDYEFREWNESNTPLDSGFARKALARQAWGFLSDYVRAHALYTH